MSAAHPLPDEQNNKGYWALLRKLGPHESVWLPVKPGTAGGHANAVFGKGNYATRKEAGGTRVWRRR